MTTLMTNKRCFTKHLIQRHVPICYLQRQYIVNVTGLPLKQMYLNLDPVLINTRQDTEAFNKVKH